MPTKRETNPYSVGEDPSKQQTGWVSGLTDERRQATRFQRDEGTDFALIWSEPGQEILAEVHDESLTGLGIFLDADFDVQVGSQFHIVYTGEYLLGEVRHFALHPNGKLLVGLRCQRITDTAE